MTPRPSRTTAATVEPDEAPRARVATLAGARDGGLLRIRAVALATGIAADTLRVWERRYGNLASRRSAAGYRLYSEADVRRLQQLRALIDAGHAIGEIATLDDGELERLSTRVARPPSPHGAEALPTRDRFLAAIDVLDTATADRAIAAARLVLSPLDLVRDLVVPLLHDVGDRWSRAEITVAQEHAASAVLRGHLGDLLRTVEPPLGAPAVIAATPEGEHHEFGALMAGIVAGTQGFRVIYLGASVPTVDLARTAADVGARAALISCVAMPASDAERAVLSIRRAMPREILLIVGGAPRREGALDEPGIAHVASLDALPALLAKLR